MARRSVAGLVQSLPGGAWVALAADMCSALGSGLTLPFLMVYLHGVRGLSLEVAGAAAATIALAGLAGNPLGGAWADRFGSKPALAAGWVAAGVGAAGLALVTQPWHAFVATGVSGLGMALALPAQDTLLARLVPESGRSSAFAVRNTTLNVGLALGGAGSTLIADVARPGTFVLLYALDAASFLAAISLLRLIRIPSTEFVPASPPDHPDTTLCRRNGYRRVFSDRLFLHLWALAAVLVTVGYAQFNTAFPAYVTGLNISATVIGVAFAANTTTVALAQLVVLRMLRGRRRTKAIIILCGLWALSWCCAWAGGSLSPGLAAVMFVSAAVIFGLGETLLWPSLPLLTNAIAPQTLRGRYNGGMALAYTLGFAAGPVLAGVLLQHGQASGLFFGLIVGCGIAAVLAATISRRLPDGADLISDDQATTASAAHESTTHRTE